MDITKYFCRTSNDKLDGRPLNVSVPGASPSSTLCAARELNELQEQKEVKTKRQVLPGKIKKEVAHYAWKHGNPEARRWASKKYPNFVFKRETVRDWKLKYQEHFESNAQEEGCFTFTVRKQGRPSMVSDELATEIKSILHNLRVSGGAISRKTVIAIGNGVMSARCPEMMSKNGGSVHLSTKWARGILKSMNWVKRRGTTAKREMNPALYEELTFTWKRKIANAIFENCIPKEMILNFDQTPLGYTAPNKATFTQEGSRSVPIANVDDKRQITGTFCVNILGDFLPIQLIYSGITDRCHPRVKFPESFHITHSSNHWSNELIVIEYLKKIIFPYLKKKREDLKLQDNAKALLIFDVFKGQTTSAVNELLRNNNIVVIHVPNNHTNLFQPLDISVNKSAKCYIAEKYQDWYAEKVLDQLNNGVNAHDIKVDVRLSIIKPLHARWIIDMYKHLKNSRSIIINGFRKAHITKAVTESINLANLCENPFQEINIVVEKSK